MRLGLTVLGCVLAVAAGAAGCGGGQGDDDGVAALPPTVSVRTASCSFWNRATPAQRHVLVTAIGKFYAAENAVDVPGRSGNRLPDAQATGLLTRSCEPVYAAGFKLYKLYGRAAGFTAPA
jgi:hypothetical protein